MGHENDRLVAWVRNELSLGQVSNFNLTKMAILLSHNDLETVRENIALILQAYGPLTLDTDEPSSLIDMAADLALMDGISANVCLAVRGMLPEVCPTVDCLLQLLPLLDDDTLTRELTANPAYLRQLMPSIEQMEQYLQDWVALVPHMVAMLEGLQLHTLLPEGENNSSELLDIVLESLLPSQPAENRYSLVRRLFSGPRASDGSHRNPSGFLFQVLVQYLIDDKKGPMLTLYDLIPSEDHYQLSMDFINQAYDNHDSLQAHNPYYLASLFLLMPDRGSQEFLLSRFDFEAEIANLLHRSFSRDLMVAIASMDYDRYVGNLPLEQTSMSQESVGVAENHLVYVLENIQVPSIQEAFVHELMSLSDVPINGWYESYIVPGILDALDQDHEQLPPSCQVRVKLALARYKDTYPSFINLDGRELYLQHAIYDYNKADVAYLVTDPVASECQVPGDEPSLLHTAVDAIEYAEAEGMDVGLALDIFRLLVVQPNIALFVNTERGQSLSSFIKSTITNPDLQASVLTILNNCRRRRAQQAPVALMQPVAVSTNLNWHDVDPDFPKPITQLSRAECLSWYVVDDLDRPQVVASARRRVGALIGFITSKLPEQAPDVIQQAWRNLSSRLEDPASHDFVSTPEQWLDILTQIEHIVCLIDRLPDPAGPRIQSWCSNFTAETFGLCIQDIKQNLSELLLASSHHELAVTAHRDLATTQGVAARAHLGAVQPDSVHGLDNELLNRLGLDRSSSNEIDDQYAASCLPAGNFIRSAVEQFWQRTGVEEFVQAQIDYIWPLIKAEHERLVDADGVLRYSYELETMLEQYGYGLTITDFYAQPTDTANTVYCDLRDDVLVKETFYHFLRQHLVAYDPIGLLSLGRQVDELVANFKELVASLSTHNGLDNSDSNKQRLLQFLLDDGRLSSNGANEILDFVFETVRLSFSEHLVLKDLPTIRSHLRHKISDDLVAAGTIAPLEHREGVFNAILVYLLAEDTDNQAFNQARQSYFDALRQDDGLGLIFSAIKYINNDQMHEQQLQAKIDRLFLCDPETDESFITRVGSNVFLGPQWLAGISYSTTSQIHQQIAIGGASAVEVFCYVEPSDSLVNEVTFAPSDSNDVLCNTLGCLSWRRGAGRTVLALLTISPSPVERGASCIIDRGRTDQARVLTNLVFLDYPGSFGSMMCRMGAGQRYSSSYMPTFMQFYTNMCQDIASHSSRLRHALSLVDAGFSVSARQLFANDSSYLQALIEPSCLRLAKQTLAACTPGPAHQRFMYSLIASSSLEAGDKVRLEQFFVRSFPAIGSAQAVGQQADATFGGDGCSVASTPFAEAAQDNGDARDPDAEISQYDSVGGGN